jgi:S-adenosylmethionine synthetase
MPFEVVERKGIGHPDTLCDALAEKISQAYSQYCLAQYGVILRHMVDKIALAGGASRVTFGGGEMITPIRLYLNCRFTRSYQGVDIPYLEIVREVVHQHFAAVMPLLDVTKWLSIVDNTHMAPGPGVVFGNDGDTSNERKFFFEVPDVKYAGHHDNGLRSNDTSTAVAYAPLSDTEQIVLLIERTLNNVEFKREHPYVGSDIKVMASRSNDTIGITICIPFVSTHTPSKDFYFGELIVLKALILGMVSSRYPYYEVEVALNTRDNPARSDYYLTATGSALESGDEGSVGRGNRYNGLIPFARHMSMEACCGKNPVYHVGKVYTAAAAIMAERIHGLTGFGNNVFLSSQMGRLLADPWQATIEICEGAIASRYQRMIRDIYQETLATLPQVTERLVRGELVLY